MDGTPPVVRRGLLLPRQLRAEPWGCTHDASTRTPVQAGGGCGGVGRVLHARVR